MVRKMCVCAPFTLFTGPVNGNSSPFQVLHGCQFVCSGNHHRSDPCCTVGPLALICIQRTVSDGRLHGIFSGIGVATADSFYAAVTFLGLTVISGLIIAQQYLFRFLAGVVLILSVYGFSCLSPQPSAQRPNMRRI